jgi:hypothetical protein
MTVFSFSAMIKEVSLPLQFVNEKKCFKEKEEVCDTSRKLYAE